MATTFPIPGAEQIAPLGLVGNAEVPVIAPQPIDEQAREKLGGFKNPFDEFALAPEQPAAPNEFDAFPLADDLDVRSVDELGKDREKFDPVQYLSDNPNVAENPARLKKLLDVRRLRDAEGLTTSGVTKAAKKTPEVLADVGGGIKRVGEGFIDLTVQPVANVLGALVTGDLFDEKRRTALFDEARKNIKKPLAELSAAEESTSFGTVDLLRQGIRKVETASAMASIPDDLPRTRVGKANVAPPKPKTDQELLAQIADDVEFRKTAEAIGKGEGEIAKTLGLDAETLAKEGISLDVDAIRQLSLVDPLSIVLSGGAYKLVSLGGKVIGTASTISGAEKLSAGLGQLAKYSTSKLAKGGGRVATDIGKGLGSRTFGTLGMASPVLTGDLSGLATAAGAKYVVAPLAKKTGAALTQVGKEIAGDLPASAGMQRLMSLAGGATDAGITIGEGAVKGAVASAPFAVMTDDDETAGAFLGAGAALGAGASGLAGGAKAGGQAFRAVKTNAARELFGPNRTPMPDVMSPDYGNPALDAVHKTEAAKLTPQNRADLNNFREALRSQGGEIYAVDKPTFRAKVADEYKARTGKELDPAMLDTYERHSAFFDETVAGKKVVYLNSDTTGLLHDSGHIFDALLSPEKQAELNTAIDKAFTPEAIAEFQSNYEKRVGNKISADDAKKEYRAELFGALFNNVPVTDLAAPKSLLKTFAGMAAEGAEALGIDLTGGTKTPSLGAPQTVGLRSAFEYAARDVLKKGAEKPPTPPPTAPPSAPGDVFQPGDFSPPPAPPQAPAPARNIRVTSEETAALTPAARAAAAERAKITGISEAREAAKADPVVSKAVEDVSTQMEAGNPVLEIEHLGITSEGTPATPEGRASRRATQAAAYEALKNELSRAGAPADLVASHSKTFVPVRWEQQGGQPTLIAMSLDKALQNIKKVASESKAASMIPYPTENGKLTANGWRDAVVDLQKYSENQSNGFRGDGTKLTVPEAGELSIPAENSNYVPQPLTAEKANFANLIQGLAPPLTARKTTKGKTPGNVKAQILAEENLRPTETPANIEPRRASKQAFIDFPGRTVKETNPLRNQLKKAGVNLDLIEVTERIRAIDIEKVTPRPEISFKAPVTDLIRAGFLPAPTEFRQKNLGGRTVEEFSQYVLDAAPEEWQAAVKNMTGGQTGGSWNLGLGLKDRGDLAVLKKYQEAASAKGTALMDKIRAMGVENAPETLFTEAQVTSTKAMFFREALEAAQGTGSAGAAFKVGRMGFEESTIKIPFPAEQPKKD